MSVMEMPLRLWDNMPDVSQPFFYQVYGNVPGIAAPCGGEGGCDASGLPHTHTRGLDAEGGSKQGKDSHKEKEWQLAHIAKIV